MNISIAQSIINLSLSLEFIRTTTSRACSYGQGAPPPPPGKNVDTTSIAGEWVPEGVLLFVVHTANKLYHLRRQSLIPGAKPSTQHQANHEQIIGELQMRIVAPALYHYHYPSWHNMPWTNAMWCG